MFKIVKVSMGGVPKELPAELQSRGAWPRKVGVVVALGRETFRVEGTYGYKRGFAKPPTFEFDRLCFDELVEAARKLGATDPAKEVRNLQKKVTDFLAKQ
ncbi:MAG: hypothetical protein DRI56_12625 [Chloroflexota bacterium]|nr:MAG: hypothetical protein DRI56_12625 [Chloroflexota bacterium]